MSFYTVSLWIFGIFVGLYFASKSIEITDRRIRNALYLDAYITQLKYTWLERLMLASAQFRVVQIGQHEYFIEMSMLGLWYRQCTTTSNRDTAIQSANHYVERKAYVQQNMKPFKKKVVWPEKPVPLQRLLRRETHVVAESEVPVGETK